MSEKQSLGSPSFPNPKSIRRSRTSSLEIEVPHTAPNVIDVAASRSSPHTESFPVRSAVSHSLSTESESPTRTSRNPKPASTNNVVQHVEIKQSGSPAMSSAERTKEKMVQPVQVVSDRRSPRITKVQMRKELKDSIPAKPTITQEDTVSVRKSPRIQRQSNSSKKRTSPPHQAPPVKRAAPKRSMN